MAAEPPTTEETREFELPIRLTIGQREIEVPLVVRVDFDTLVRIVERHLSDGEDIYAQLMEHYADQAGRKRPRKPAKGADGPPTVRPRAEEAPSAAADGARRGGRRKRGPDPGEGAGSGS